MILPEAPAAIAMLQHLYAAPDWLYHRIVHIAAAARLDVLDPQRDVCCVDTDACNNTYNAQLDSVSGHAEKRRYKTNVIKLHRSAAKLLYQHL